MSILFLVHHTNFKNSFPSWPKLASFHSITLVNWGRGKASRNTSDNSNHSYSVVMQHLPQKFGAYSLKIQCTTTSSHKGNKQLFHVSSRKQKNQYKFQCSGCNVWLWLHQSSLSNIESTPSQSVSPRSILISSHLCTSLPSGLFPSGFSRFWMHFSSPHVCYMPYPSHPPWFDHPINICSSIWSSHYATKFHTHTEQQVEHSFVSLKRGNRKTKDFELKYQALPSFKMLLISLRMQFWLVTLDLKHFNCATFL